MRKKNPSFDFQQYGQIETNRDKYIGKRGFAMEIPFFFLLWVVGSSGREL